MKAFTPSRREIDELLLAIYGEKGVEDKYLPTCKTWWKYSWFDDVIMSWLHDRFCGNCRYHNRVKVNLEKFMRRTLLREEPDAYEEETARSQRP